MIKEFLHVKSGHYILPHFDIADIDSMVEYLCRLRSSFFFL